MTAGGLQVRSNISLCTNPMLGMELPTEESFGQAGTCTPRPLQQAGDSHCVHSMESKQPAKACEDESVMMSRPF